MKCYHISNCKLLLARNLSKPSCSESYILSISIWQNLSISISSKRYRHFATARYENSVANIKQSTRKSMNQRIIIDTSTFTVFRCEVYILTFSYLCTFIRRGENTFCIGGNNFKLEQSNLNRYLRAYIYYYAEAAHKNILTYRYK